MSVFHFYYDESEHSRIINLNTFKAQNYYDNFVAGIVGWSQADEPEIYNRYLEFEKKYEYRKSHGELKSTTIAKKELTYGFASMNKQNVLFLNDFFALFGDDILVYFSVASKMEFLITQLFSEYQNSVFCDMDAIKYSIIKAILMYRPERVLKCAFDSPKDLVLELKNFFSERINYNQRNAKLKAQENDAFKCIMRVLDDINPQISNSWNYCIPFWGFEQYLNEKSIEDYTLTIDKEGEEDSESNTLIAARSCHIKNTREIDSKQCVGVRMADMLVGLIGKLSKSLHNALSYNAESKILQKKLLSAEWFKLNDEQLVLYKKLYYIICQLNNAWYKSYSGIYSDDLVVFVALLNFINHFSSVKEIDDAEMQTEYFNSYCCECLEERFKQLHNKLPIEFAPHTSADYFFNQRGAKVFLDIRKQPQLPLNEGENLYYVLSVGFGNDMTPLITIQKETEILCYRLPNLLSDWAMDLVAVANSGSKLLPSQVVFTKVNSKIYADIL